MKRSTFLTVCALAVLLCGTLAAQTKVTTANLAGEQSATGRVFVVLPSGTVALAEIGPGIVVDTSGPVPVLRVQTPAAPVEVVERNKLPAPQAVFTLGFDPLPGLAVYRNGLLMAEGEDYTVTSRVVTFAPVQPPGGGDIVQFRYRRVP